MIADIVARTVVTGIVGGIIGWINGKLQILPFNKKDMGLVQ